MTHYAIDHSKGRRAPFWSGPGRPDANQISGYPGRAPTADPVVLPDAKVATNPADEDTTVRSLTDAERDLLAVEKTDILTVLVLGLVTLACMSSWAALALAFRTVFL